MTEDEQKDKDAELGRQVREMGARMVSSDRTRVALATCLRSMRLWAAEEDGLPDAGYIEAYQAYHNGLDVLGIKEGEEDVIALRNLR